MPDEPKDTLPGDEELEETIPADTADDTLAAGAGDDTIEAGAADDTVEADAGSPFDGFDDPTPEAETKVSAGAASTEPDDIDKELEAVEQALETDPGDPEALKKYVVLNRQARKRDAAKTNLAAKRAADAAEEAEYRRFEAASGLVDAPREVRQKITKAVVYQRFDKHFKAEVAAGASPEEARGAAKSTLRHEIKQIIAAAGKKTKTVAKVKRTESGATLTPPGGGGRPAKEKVADEDVFIKGDWQYPSTAGLQ